MSTSVYFFGGFNATQNHIDSWVRSAHLQKPNVTFIGFLWDSGPKSWPPKTIVDGAKKSGQFKAAVDAIDACTADTIYIVGHSSGCAVANAVDKAIKSTSNVTLVALDGVTPDDDQLKRSTTQAWGAECEGQTSKNYPGPAGGWRKVYHAKNCNGLWALHFVLVNAAANDTLVTSIASGYSHCQANLAWL